jgi:hypothetical protein
MAVVSMMRISGDPDELAAKVEEHLRPVGRKLAPKHGGLGTIVAKTSDGIIAINLWETEEGRHAMAQEPEIQAAVQAAGLPEPHFEGYEVAHYTFLPEAVESSS